MYIEMKKEEFIHHMINKINENLKENKFGYKAEAKRHGLGVDVESKKNGYPVYNFYIWFLDNNDIIDIGKLIEFTFRINEQYRLDKEMIVDGFFEESDNIKNSHIRIKRILSKIDTLKYSLANIELKDIKYDYMNLLESNGEYLKTSINEYDINEVEPLVYPTEREHFSIQIEITNAILCALIDVIVRILEIELGDKNKIIVEANRDYDTPMGESYKHVGYRVNIEDLPKELRTFIKGNPDYDIRKLILNRKYGDRTIKIESKNDGYGIGINHKYNDLYVTINKYRPEEINTVTCSIDFLKNLDFLLDSEEFERLLANTVNIINKEEK